MGAFINRGEGAYQPFRPQDPSLLAYRGEVVEPVEQDGLFYRRPDTAELPITTIQDYQAWTERGWKKEHGTYAASERFIGKMEEESLEMMQALVDYTEHPDDEHRTAALSELGDVLWCATALASNSGCSINDAIANRMYEYAVGIRYMDARGYDGPWRMQARLMATEQTPTTIVAIDELIMNDFEPTASPRMNIDPPSYGADMSRGQHAFYVASIGVFLRTAINYQYQPNEAIEMGIRPKPFDFLTDEGVAPLVADAYLNIAYLAQKCVAGTLQEVIDLNKQKIDSRITEGLIDKTDGLRAFE